MVSPVSENLFGYLVIVSVGFRITKPVLERSLGVKTQTVKEI
jgi:hypothetical protein